MWSASMSIPTSLKQRLRRAQTLPGANLYDAPHDLSRR